eukprot:scaffold51652_cov29-Prasinocladus_malaysianus.AAC.1
MAAFAWAFRLPSVSQGEHQPDIESTAPPAPVNTGGQYLCCGDLSALRNGMSPVGTVFLVTFQHTRSVFL